ncbi:hypothetical protein N7539_001173 [Penicillium diatomitis]|uniref:Uncharacterized protein n=1 Tax=Penicillium diatomitis TaxID=2819901 RepID=A0A9X0C2X4_9EURO|nr:uncharacterized protein N7539_001173 [Penicillium diatomitis]KAJ5496057.1 hypothetical protein N7539_001173 [Penicillium diatomitis]
MTPCACHADQADVPLTERGRGSPATFTEHAPERGTGAYADADADKIGIDQVAQKDEQGKTRHEEDSQLMVKRRKR